MKNTFLLSLCMLFVFFGTAQKKSTVREYKKVFKTYPFSDADPVPDPGKIYPYYRFDGYTHNGAPKEWKVVELENDFIRIMILPEIGGKIWSAVEKSTGKSFIYYNNTVKFRDVAMRGPWTSGGIEANYAIIGHTPNCATPVDYTTIQRPDGSVSCVIGVLDLLTRTSWRVDINLAKDKAYFTTSSFWYNSSAIEQPYYTWMNTGLKASGNLEFVYPGTKYIGHEGEYADWPINKENGKNISFYENNNFGGYKSYHVFGKYTDFFGAYWHDEDFGMGRYSTHDDKAGKKIWIWGLSGQGMIWDKILTDTDGQYVEVQSGRLFNQAAEGSTLTPFKHTGFLPHGTDVWTEYWFPVLKTKGFVAANNYGSLNVTKGNGSLTIHFSPLQDTDDEITVTDGDKQLYAKKISLAPLEVFADSFALTVSSDSLIVRVGGNKLIYSLEPTANNLNRPVDAPKDFDWNAAYGLYVQGKENLRQRFYQPALEQLKASLLKNPDYVPALAALSMVYYRSMQYGEALAAARKALSVDTYDGESNYYYGLINARLGNIADAKDGFDISAMGIEYRSAAYTGLANIYLQQRELDKAVMYARKSIEFNKYAVDAWQTLAVVYRIQNNKALAYAALDTLLQQDPLNHFSRFEKYLWQPTAENQQAFTGLIRNEMPRETFLELAAWYKNSGQNTEAAKMLSWAPANAETLYWLAYLDNKPLNIQELKPDMVFPFRQETAEILKNLLLKSDYWLLKYHLALIEWNYGNIASAEKLFSSCGETPDYAPFYATRSSFYSKTDSVQMLKDLVKARNMDKTQWRYGRSLINYYLGNDHPARALDISREYHQRFPENYIIGMLHIKSLMRMELYAAANEELKKINILPNEGATEGHLLYKESYLMMAIAEMGRKKYSKALSYIAASRLWPEQLGVGKPYPEDIDERLEDWLEYESNRLQGKTAAAKMALNKTLTTKIPLKKNGMQAPSANYLVSALALKASGQEKEGLELLKKLAEENPQNGLALWSLAVYSGETPDPSPEFKKDENYRVLTRLLQGYKKSAK